MARGNSVTWDSRFIGEREYGDSSSVNFRLALYLNMFLGGVVDVLITPSSFLKE